MGLAFTVIIKLQTSRMFISGSTPLWRRRLTTSDTASTSQDLGSFELRGTTWNRSFNSDTEPSSPILYGVILLFRSKSLVYERKNIKFIYIVHSRCGEMALIGLQDTGEYSPQGKWDYLDRRLHLFYGKVREPSWCKHHLLRSLHLWSRHGFPWNSSIYCKLSV